MQRPTKTLFIARLAILVALTLVIQMTGFPQPVTGPLVNAMLIITTVFAGSAAGVTLGCVTPLTALIRGQLPPVLAPMVPFIAIANALLVLVFFLFYKNNRSNLIFYAGLIFAAVAKFAFLFASVRFLLPVVFGHDIPDKFILAMSTPQLFTALAGGFIAAVFIKVLRRSTVMDQNVN